MSENSAASSAGASPPPDDYDADATLVAGASDAEASVAPDMAPTSDAFDTLGASDSATPPGPSEGGPDDEEGADDADDADRTAAGGVVSAGRGLLARIPGQRRHWIMGGMVSGGILLGGLASGGIAWKIINDRNAEVAARTAKLDLQSSRISEQEAQIQVLTRAIQERPLPEPADASAGGTPPAAPDDPSSADGRPGTTDTAAGSTPAANVVVPPPPAAKAAEPPPPAAKAPAQAAPRPPASGGLANTSAPGSAGAPPSIAGSGICDVPGGADATTHMRKCIEWFAGRDKPAARPAP